VVATPVDVLDKQLNNMAWSERVAGCFRQMGVKTVRDLVRLWPSELMREPNFGWGCLREVERRLAEF
jgi:DNA-directed RNA polymerase alpha subunit